MLNQSFEQNKHQIQQTHDIINVIENKLNQFLQKRGVKQQASPESNQASTYRDGSPEKALEMKLQQMESAMDTKLTRLQQRLKQLEQENRQLQLENEDIQHQNRLLKQGIKEIELKQKIQLEEQLEVQRQQLQKRFERQVMEMGDQAKEKLLQTLDHEEQYLHQYNQLIEEKAHYLSELDSLRARNRALLEERDDLAQSYQQLLQIHNQMLKMDANLNQSQIQRKSEKNDKSQIQNQYRHDLEQIKHQVNDGAQNRMEREIVQLKEQLEKQKTENMELIRDMSMRESERRHRDTTPLKDLNELYQKVFKEEQQSIPPKSRRRQDRLKEKEKDKESEKTPTRSKSKKQSKESKKGKENQIKKFEKELKRLKGIVHDRIIAKKKEHTNEKERHQ